LGHSQVRMAPKAKITRNILVVRPVLEHLMLDCE
jgi:hypothetical protein